jgi:hypothetical protein
LRHFSDKLVLARSVVRVGLKFGMVLWASDSVSAVKERQCVMCRNTRNHSPDTGTAHSLAELLGLAMREIIVWILRQSNRGCGS